MSLRDRIAKAEAPTFVYVASSEGRTKIGIAEDATARARQLANGAGANVKLAASRQFSTRLSAERVEKALHRRFSAHRLMGEWFAIAPVAVIEALENTIDPQLHTGGWAPGMPGAVATAGAIERFKWLQANEAISIDTYAAIYGRNAALKLMREAVTA